MKYTLRVIVLTSFAFFNGWAWASEQQIHELGPSTSLLDLGGSSASGISASAEDPSLRWPEFQSSWGLKEPIYRLAQLRYQELLPKLKNYRYAVVIDFSRHSSKRRFFLFDLMKGSVESHLTAHGSGSDPEHSGMATLFSNVPQSQMSSLGAYITGSSYEGGHGYSMLLYGQDPTNDNAESRAIVLHPADYVDEGESYAGNSWGCPAMDPSVSTGVIDKIKDGAFLFIGTVQSSI